MREASEMQDVRPSKLNPFLLLTFVVAVGALVLSIYSVLSITERGSTAAVSTLDEVNTTNTLRVGYELYSPYSIKEPGSDSLSGYSIDMARWIGKQTGWNIEWVRTNPRTKITDLKQGRFDVMVEPIFATMERAQEVAFTKPYAYFGYATGIVKKGEPRFNRVEELDDPNVTVAVRQGYTDQNFAEENFPNANIRALSVDDIAQLFVEVLSGHADIALADAHQVRAYLEEHQEAVESRFLDDPPAYTPAGFIIRKGDFEFLSFLNTAIGIMESGGVLQSFDKEYGVESSEHPKK